MKKILVLALAALGVMTGCATIPSAPPEPLISVQLRGTSVEVQEFIEDRFRKNQGLGFRVENATDRAITFKAHCMDMPDMNAFKCTSVMMSIGNSRWDGPFAVLTFRTSEIRGVVNLTATSEWCATNAFGKSNCRPNGSNAELNDLLRRIDQAYQSASSTLSVRPGSNKLYIGPYYIGPVAPVDNSNDAPTDKSEARKIESKTVIIRYNSISIYSEPGFSSIPLGIKEKGTSLNAVEENDNWYKVMFDGSNFGWVSKSWVDTE